jgi:hypothetical protein
LTRLQRTATQAAATLRRNLKAARPADQIRAAVSVLDYALRGVGLIDLLERIEGLERLAKGEGDEPEWQD